MVYEAWELYVMCFYFFMIIRVFHRYLKNMWTSNSVEINFVSQVTCLLHVRSAFSITQINYCILVTVLFTKLLFRQHLSSLEQSPRVQTSVIIAVDNWHLEYDKAAFMWGHCFCFVSVVVQGCFYSLKASFQIRLWHVSFDWTLLYE